VSFKSMQPKPDSLVQSSRKERPMASVSTLSDLGMTHDPAMRGYHVVYREHEVNHCPGCGRTQWLIGRMSAECAFCSTPCFIGGGMRHAPAGDHPARNRVKSPWAPGGNRPHRHIDVATLLRGGTNEEIVCRFFEVGEGRQPGG
jgi:hypothetical protein